MSAEVIDKGALRRLLDVIGGDPEDRDELLEDDRSTGPEIVGTIGAAAIAGDLEAVRIAAHTLKSNARDFRRRAALIALRGSRARVPVGSRGRSERRSGCDRDRGGRRARSTRIPLDARSRLLTAR